MKKVVLAVFILFFNQILFANVVHDLLMGLSPNEQTQKLGALLNASETPCSATVSFFRGFDEDGAAYWSVACSNGESYQIQIANDSVGSSRILECSVLMLTGNDCFKKFQSPE
jgi:hypothetical protein